MRFKHLAISLILSSAVLTATGSRGAEALAAQADQRTAQGAARLQAIRAAADQSNRGSIVLDRTLKIAERDIPLLKADVDCTLRHYPNLNRQQLLHEAWFYGSPDLDPRHFPKQTADLVFDDDLQRSVVHSFKAPMPLKPYQVGAAEVVWTAQRTSELLAAGNDRQQVEQIVKQEATGRPWLKPVAGDATASVAKQPPAAAPTPATTPTPADPPLVAPQPDEPELAVPPAPTEPRRIEPSAAAPVDDGQADDGPKF